jgi:hypothetical protein
MRCRLAFRKDFGGQLLLGVLCTGGRCVDVVIGGRFATWATSGRATCTKRLLRVCSFDSVSGVCVCCDRVMHRR